MFDNDIDDDAPTPPRNEPLIKLYELVCSLVRALPATINTASLHDGSGERLNGYIGELVTMTGDSRLNDFQVRVYNVNRRNHVTGESYARQLSGLINYLHSTNETLNYYCVAPPSIKSPIVEPTSPTIHNHLSAQQDVSQNTEVQIEINQTLVSMAEKLTNIERDHPDEASKENRFAKALKKGLPAIKNSLDIVALVLKIAGEVGLNPQSALRLLGLG